MYNGMLTVEQGREKKDLLYHIINNNEASTLNDICQRIATHVAEKYAGLRSIRFKHMLAQVIENDDRVAKHALVFFALAEEPSCREIFMSNPPRVPPEKFNSFISSYLPTLVEKLTNGAFTSLRAFAEDARWTYCTL